MTNCIVGTHGANYLPLPRFLPMLRRCVEDMLWKYAAERRPPAGPNVPSSILPRNPRPHEIRQGYRGIVIVAHCRAKGLNEDRGNDTTV